MQKKIMTINYRIMEVVRDLWKSYHSFSKKKRKYKNYRKYNKTPCK